MFCPRELKGEGKVRTPLRSPRVPSRLEGVGTFLGGTSCSLVGFPMVQDLQSKTFQLPKPGQQLQGGCAGVSPAPLSSSGRVHLCQITAGPSHCGSREKDLPISGTGSACFPPVLRAHTAMGRSEPPERVVPCSPPRQHLCSESSTEGVKLAIFFERSMIHESHGGEESCGCWIKLRPTSSFYFAK